MNYPFFKGRYANGSKAHISSNVDLHWSENLEEDIDQSARRIRTLIHKHPESFRRHLVYFISQLAQMCTWIPDILWLLFILKCWKIFMEIRLLNITECWTSRLLREVQFFYQWGIAGSFRPRNTRHWASAKRWCSFWFRNRRFPERWISPPNRCSAFVGRSVSKNCRSRRSTRITLLCFVRLHHSISKWVIFWYRVSAFIV